MSDTTAEAGATAKQQPSAKVSMRKPAQSARPAVQNIKPPRTIDYACIALGVMVVAGIARALLLLGNTAMLTAYAIKQNHDAKTPQKNFDAVKAVHQFREGAVITAVVIAIAIGLLIWALRRTRSASASRWAMLIVFVFTGLPFYVIPTHGLPGAATVAGVVLGIAAIAAILLIFVPKPSLEYFKACRAANVPPGGQPRPGLGSLFAPRKPRDKANSPTIRASAPRSANLDPSRPPVPKAKAKVRADSDAVARGAELARARAKAASKSRRTTD